jgi:integrase
LKWYEREVEPVDWRNPINKVAAPIVPLEPLDPVSIETIKAMMETCKQGKLSDARDKASLLVLLDTGMRLAEFLVLNKEDVDLITGMILILRERAGAIVSQEDFFFLSVFTGSIQLR